MGELIDKGKGKIKHAEGKVTGNAARRVEGALDEAKGKVKGAFEGVQRDVEAAFDDERTDPAVRR